MITQQSSNRSIPKRSSAAIFAFIILCTAIAMSCTDMQTQNVFDEEELDLMTDIDQNGERGYHQVLIFMGDEGQSERHKEALDQLRQLQPKYINEIEILKGDAALENFGNRASEGVIVIKTKRDPTSYNTVLKVLGMEPQKVPPPSSPTDPSDKQDYFVVVEEMPELIGGLEGIMKNIRYPEEARKKGIEGRVYVQFVVTEDGNVDDARVIRGIGAGADEEALRVVKKAKFEPGYQRGKPVRVQYSLPIFFRLQRGENSSNKMSPPSPPTSDENSNQVFKVVDEMPELIGGFEGLRKNIRYPEEAKQAGIEGHVLMQLIVNKQGNVEDAKVDRGIGHGADEEALRVIRQAKFEPGYQNGKPVRVQYSLGISFRLPQEES